MGLKVVEAVEAPKIEEVTLPSHKEAEKSLQDTSTLESLYLEMLDLERRIKAVGAAEMMKRKEEVRKEILAQPELEEAPPYEPYVLSGDEGVIEFSAASKKKVLSDKKALLNAIGLDAFIELASFSITDLKKVLSEKALDSIAETQKGSRTLKTIILKG